MSAARTIQIAVSDTLPAREAVSPILSAYYATVVSRLRAVGVEVPEAAPESALAEFWAHVDGYMPPRGCIALARDAEDGIVGIGMLKCLDA